MADVQRPALLSALLDLVERATRPGAVPSPEVLAELRDAAARLEEAEFISLTHEARRGLDLRAIAHEAAAFGGTLPTGVSAAELAEVDEAWGLGTRPRITTSPAAPSPTRSTRTIAALPVTIRPGRTTRSIRVGPKADPDGSG